MGKQAAPQQKPGRPATEAALGRPQQSAKPQQSAQKPAAAQQKPAAQSKPQIPSSDEDEDNEHGDDDDDAEDEEEDDEMGDDGSYDSAEEEEGLEDLGEFLGFWSNKVSPVEDGAIDVCAGHMRVLKITTAALGLDAPKGARSSLVVRVPRQQPEEDEDEAEPEDEDDIVFDEFVICTLSEARPDVQLELFYTGTEYVQLKVVGNASIDLTGAVTYMDTGVGGEDEYDEGDEHAGPEDEDEEEEEGLYDEDGEVVQGAHAFADDSEDSEAEADAHGAAAVHRRDAAKAAGKRNAAKKALPSIIQELMGGAGSSDEDQEDANESFRPDADDDDEDEDDEDAESEDDASELSDLLSPENAERARQKLKGKIEVVNSPQQKPVAAAPKPKQSPQQKPAQAPKSPQQKPAAPAAAPAATPSNKRKNDDSAAAPAAAAAAPQTPANKKAKTDGAAKTPAAAAGTPAAAAGAFQCAHCPRAFQQEAALKQHAVTKHAAATPKKA